ncbi:MAG: hypothetical protein ACLS8R_02485 [Anaeromassilibacillus sp.]
MKKSMKVRLFSGLVALCMLLAFLPTAAFAAGNDVAQIGDQTYATLDDAIAATRTATPSCCWMTRRSAKRWTSPSPSTGRATR